MNDWLARLRGFLKRGRCGERLRPEWILTVPGDTFPLAG